MFSEPQSWFSSVTHSASSLTDLPLASMSPRKITTCGRRRFVTCQLFFKFNSKMNWRRGLNQTVSWRRIDGSCTCGSETNKTRVDFVETCNNCLRNKITGKPELCVPFLSPAICKRKGSRRMNPPRPRRTEQSKKDERS